MNEQPADNQPVSGEPPPAPRPPEQTPPVQPPIYPPPGSLPTNQPNPAPTAPPSAAIPGSITPPSQPISPPPPPPSAAPVTPTPTITSESIADQKTGNQFSSLVWALVLGLVNWLVVPAAIVLILHLFVFQAFHVVGSSMIPTLDQSDYLIVSKVNASLARFGKLVGKSGDYIPRRGEIIVFHYPRDPNLVFVKRVIGIPGDRVVVTSGKVTVYNTKNPQGFSPDQGYQVADPVTLGEVDQIIQPGKVFVMGDNRTPNGSFDSRDWGELPSGDIIGKAVMRLLPLNKFKIVEHPKVGSTYTQLVKLLE